jgi:SAM-dependent methyltransferase
MTVEELYANPEYYEIAFSFRDIKNEVDVFEECISRYSNIPVKRVLELGSGNSPHMVELLNRGYEYVGIDTSDEMLEYASLKAKTIGAQVELLSADMADFQLGREVEFGFILLGSLYVAGTDALLSHLNSMARAISPGGLYLLDWCIEFEPLDDHEQSWDMESDGVNVKTTYRTRVVNRIEQTFEETIALDVDDHGERKHLEHKCVRRAILPQEFLLITGKGSDFEFVGWWNNWDLERPLVGDEKIDRPIALLRRT